MKNFLVQSTIVLLCILPCFFLSAQTIYVDTDAAAGGDGTTWLLAYNTLEPALTAAATNGYEIWVAEGSYFINGSTDDSFEIPSGVKVYGGFSGIENQRQGRDWEARETILDGVFNIHTIVYFEDSNTNTTLDGFTIQNGFADGSSSRGKSGSGIYIDNGSPNIVNCHIKDNTAVNQGGAIFIDGSFSRTANPKFENCTIEDNVSMSNGGAVFGGGNDGGLLNAIFDKCIFKNNSCADSGGALFLNGVDGNATNTFKKCDFDSNIASGNGGAIYTLATTGGEGNHTITNSRFYRNKGNAAGGIYNNGGNGGDASPILTNCTFYLNEATGAPSVQGGAIYNNGSGGTSNTIVINSIIYGNIGPFGSHIFKNVDAFPTISYSLVDAADCDDLNDGHGAGTTCGVGMVYNQDPLFEDIGTGDLRLQITPNSSPAVNVGNDADNNEPEDLDCGQRKINTIDMGAYEAPDQNLPVDLAEFGAFLEEDKVTLYWITISEENNASFVVERSADGRNFEDLLSIPGAGTTFDVQTYKAYDYHPISGANYYRLKNISFSGEIEYSPIRIVEMSEEKISVFPNPVEDHLTITFSNFKEDEAHFEIYNIYGKQVYQGSTTVENEVSFISLSEIGSFVPGYYILKVHTSKNGHFSQRFQKIRD